MSDLEVFRLSALACEQDLGPDWGQGDQVMIGGHSGRRAEEWNPFTDAEQRWECVRKLLENDGVLILCGDTTDHHEFYRYQDNDAPTDMFNHMCPAEEFPARVLAELEARNAR